MCSTLAAVVVLALAAPIASARGSVSRRSGPRFVPGEVVVRYRSDVPRAQRASLRSGLASSFTALPLRGAQLMTLAPGESVSDAVAQLEASPDVLYAEPNYIIEATATLPNEPGFSNLWGLDSIGDVDIDAPEAWDVTTGSTDVKVGVLDSGIDYTHPDLAANIWHNPGESGDGKENNGIDDDGNGFIDDVRGWDFAADDADPMDTLGHGTHVAGTIGARGNNGAGVTGVNWNVTLVPLRALSGEGVGNTADAANAIVYARSLGVSVINMSFGGPGYSRMMTDAIGNSSDITFVASAGNEGADNDSIPIYPCNLGFDNVICVAATDSNDQLAGYSNHGATSVDLGAPGSNIVSTIPGGRYAWYSGTSMAAPHVAGAAALLRAAAPAATATEITASLLGGVVSVPALAGKTVTGGRLNLAASVASIVPASSVPSEPDPASLPPTESVPDVTEPIQPDPVPPTTDPSPQLPMPSEEEPIDAAPEPAPAEEQPVVHDRSISLTLAAGPVARGRVVAGDGFSACERHVVVKIKRNGTTIARVATDSLGRFRASLPTRSGRYSVVAVRKLIGDDVCAAAISGTRTLTRR